MFLWTALQHRQSLFTPYGPVAFMTDFLLNVCAILFAITAYSSVPLFLNIFLITPALLLLLPLQATRHTNRDAKKSKAKSKQATKATPSSRDSSWQLVSRPFITHYRGAMMIVTVLAILAVDFPIFPRRFAKVETWGTSLMDIGVGSFVYSAGVVSARALFKTSKSGKLPGLSSRVLKALRHSLPLLVLGIIRLISVKGLDYAEHVTEYGVHWNFFFTLALLPPFVELADSAARGVFRSDTASYGFLALAISTTYEIILNNSSLLSYILISPRGPDLLSKNREGVFSFLGYLAIFLSGRGTGSYIIRLVDRPSLKDANHFDDYTLTRRERLQVLWRLATEALVPLLLYWLSTSVYVFNLNVSRRLANLPYVLGVVAFNQVQIYLFGLVEAYGPTFSYEEGDDCKLRSASSRIMQVFNKNGLVIFLVANLLTGLVNLSINTLDMSNIGAMGILITYAAVVTAVAMGFDHFGLKIKF